MGTVTSFDPRHQWQFYEEFTGGGSFGGASAYDPWVITDTSIAGTPTYIRSDLGEATVVGAQGVAALSFDSQAEAQNVCLSWGDKLGVDINKVDGFETRVRMGQATIDATSSFACGLAGDRNDAIDTVAFQTLFRVVGADSTTALVVESDDDASENNDDVATGTTLVNAWKILRIDYTDLSSVKFYVNEAQVASGTAFDMSVYDAGLQPFFQLQKTSDANTDSVEIDYVHIWGRR